MFSLTAKTLSKGLGKTRAGKPSIGLQTVIDRLKKAELEGFVTRLKAAVSEEEAIDAAKLLSQKRKDRVQRFAEGGTIGALASPVMRAAGRAAEAVVSTPGGIGKRMTAAGKASLRTTPGELVRHVTEGGLAGGGVQAIREGVELGKANKTVQSFLDERRQQLKQAGVEPAPQSKLVPKKKPSDPWKYDPRPVEWM